VQAAFWAFVSVALYGVFLAIQNVRHRAYFRSSLPAPAPTLLSLAYVADVRSVRYHTIFLLAYAVPLVILSKHLAVPITSTISVLGAPIAVAGVIVATLVLAPEALAAVRAALANDLQRAVNILLGSVLATIGLTIPAVLTFGLLATRTVVLGLAPVDIIMLALTLILSTMTFTSSRTNVLLGAVHLLLFLIYLLLIFQR